MSSITKGASGTSTFNFTGGTLQAAQAGDWTTNIAVPLSGTATIDMNGCDVTIQSLVTSSGLTDLNFLSPGIGEMLFIGSGGWTVAPKTAITFEWPPIDPGDYPLFGGKIGTPCYRTSPCPALRLAWPTNW